METWSGRVDLGGWLHSEMVYLPANNWSPIHVLTRLSVDQLHRDDNFPDITKFSAN